MKFLPLHCLAAALAVGLSLGTAAGRAIDPSLKYAATWAASAYGPSPLGNAGTQPDLQAAIPDQKVGAVDQSFRMIVRPDLWGRTMRIRLSNAWGERPVTFDGVFVGLHGSAGSVVEGTNAAVRFGGSLRVTVAPGATVVSDPVQQSYVHDPADRLLTGRKLAVSFHVVGPSGPMTWHAKALTTSYLTAPHAGSRGADEGSLAFPYPTLAWYFLDEVEVLAPVDTPVIAAFGDSITDGANSTINGDDRWPDVLSERLHAMCGAGVSVVNEGIGGNQIVAPAGPEGDTYSGGPSALRRLDRDVLSLAGLTTVIWFEGINDLGWSKATAETVIQGLKDGVTRLRQRKLRVIGATITSSLHSRQPTHGTPEVDARRRVVNEFIRHSGLFDAVIDFDAATLDSATGSIRAEFQPPSTIGRDPDRLHPNRAGFIAMAAAADLEAIVPRPSVALTEGPAKFEGDVVAGEGPSWDPAGWLYFVGKPDRISRRSPEGKIEVFREPAGRPGSSLVDPQGRLLVCESGARRITRIEKDGRVTVLADRYRGQRFNTPNDLALDSHGRVYFTDPRYGDRTGMEMKDEHGELVEGVYRIDAPGQVARVLTHEIGRPNGILVSPDDRYLYVADNRSGTPGGTSTLVRFDLRPDGGVDPGTRHLVFDWGTKRGADGFKFDRAGRLYVAGGQDDPGPGSGKFKSGIYILSPEGRLLEFVRIPHPVTNCAFGGADLKTLYVTGAGWLWSVRTTTPGVISAEVRRP